MSNLAAITNRVEQVLADTANAIWDTTWIEEGIRQALSEYNLTIPNRQFSTYVIDGLLSANGREIELIDFPSVDSIIEVNKVVIPYNQDDTEEYKRSFRYYRDKQIIILNDYIAENTDIARLFFTVPHTIESLDSATATTVWHEHETLLVTGAAGHVAASRSLDLTEQVTIDKLTGQQVRAWGLSKLQEFRSALRTAGRTAGGGTPWVALPGMDRWDN